MAPRRPVTSAINSAGKESLIDRISLFLLFSLVFVAAVSLSVASPEDASQPQDTQPSSPVTNTKVIILGGGIAGLAAARHLKEHGISDFVLLEGMEQVGGRLRSVRIANATIELGANWVHGITDNPIWTLTKRFAVKCKMSHFDDVDFVGPGTRSTSEEEIENRFAYLEKTCENKVKIQRRARRECQGDFSLRVALRMAGWLPKSSIDSALEYYNYDFEYARTAEETSFLGSRLHVYEDFDSENCVIGDSRGFRAIAEGLQEEIFSQTDQNETVPLLRLGRNVTEIISSSGLWDVPKETYRYLVRATHYDKEERYAAEHVILTFSMGVLQNGLVQFKPQLPAWKVEEINKVDVGVYSKVVIALRRRFWGKEQFFIYISNRRGYMVPWINLDYVLSVAEDSPVHYLAVILTEEDGERIESQPLDDTRREVLSVLADLFPDALVTGADVVDMKVTDWSQHLFFQGSYSNTPVGLTLNNVLNLRMPIGNLHFAGEATSERYNGYLQGGYESGIRAAGEVLANLNRRQCTRAAEPLPYISSSCEKAPPLSRRFLQKALQGDL